MARYLEVVREANSCATALFELIQNELDNRHEEEEIFLGWVAEAIARLVNYGVRCSPRAVQSTVRLNAVREAVRGLPVSVKMETREDEHTGRTYNVLVTTPTTQQQP